MKQRRYICESVVVAEKNQTDAVMDVHKQNSNGSSFSSSDVSPPENHTESLDHHTSHLGTVIPNRIFVGGIDYKVNESDLRNFFSQHGVVKHVKIVIDPSGISKGYGFVTFETQEEALKILHDANGICFKDKKLNIGQAVRKRQASQPTKSIPLANPHHAMPLPISCETLYLTTSTGYPYIYHNGVAYFHSPNISPPACHWLPAAAVIQSHHPVYQQPACYHCQWNVVQPPMPSSPVVYSQQSEYFYQNTDGDSVQPPLLVMEDTTPEFVEPPVQQVYPVYHQTTDRMTPIVLQHRPGKLKGFIYVTKQSPENLMFPHTWVHLKPKRHRYIHCMSYHYFPDATEPPVSPMLHSSLSVM